MKSIGTILSNESYRSQLANPAWRAFASNVRSTRKSCECCRRSDVELQVHHLFYDFDRKLWEYDKGDVMVLCASCHKELHEQLKAFRVHVFKHLSPKNFQILNGALAVALTQYDPLVFVHALAEFVGNQRLVENHAKAWQMSAANKVEFKPKWNPKSDNRFKTS